MFGLQKNLTDLVRGIRTNKKNESQYIGQALQEIREELRSPEAQKKTVAVQKLTYLQMLGYDMSWAAFNIIEVMSQPKFTPKRIGYLAASQSFNEKTEVITLVTNLIRKDMTSSNVWESGIALNCLSNICTPDLARDLAADVVSLLSSSKPYIRKKACLVLYKVFLKFPDALRPSFPRLKEKLEDPDPAVVAASVNVICELARKNPKNYIALAPTLFKILTSSTNNWVLIKIVKLFANLLPIEPRLGPKLVQPLTNLINNTPAVSLLYECIQACTIGLHEHLPTIKLCISKLRSFVEDPDQNLKYLGLISLSNIMKIHPKAVGEHRDLVVNCLDDEDVSIRLRALDLLEGMVTKKNVLDIVRKLLDQIEKSDSQTYKDALVDKIVTICSKNIYAVITDFEWYISVLMELAHVNTAHGELVASQLMDVIIRVQVVRPFGVKSMVTLLRDITFFTENLSRGGNCEVLYSAAWVTGEFASFIAEPLAVMESLLQPKVAQLPSHVQSVYMQTILKIFSTIVSSDSHPSPSPFNKNLIETEDDIVSTPTPTPVPQVNNSQTEEFIQLMNSRLPLFSQSEYLEVQERACFVIEVVNLYKDLRTSGISVAQEIASLFDEPLNPVNPKAQKKVPVPEDLDLDSWINEPEPEPQEIVYEKGFDFISKYDDEEDEEKEEQGHTIEKIPKGPTTVGTSKSSPWYLGSGPNTPTSGSFENIPTVTLTAEDLGLGKGESANLSHKDRVRKAKPKRHTPHVTVLKDEDLPPGTNDSDSDKEDKSGASHNPFANINFNEPLRPEEKLYVPTHRVTTTTSPTKSSEPAKKKKSSTTDKPKKKKKSTTEKKPSAVGNLLGFDSETPQVGFEELSSPVERKEKKKKSSTATGEKKKKTTSKSAKKSETKAATAPVPSVSSPSAGPKAVPKFKPLCQDENLSVIYELRVNPKQPKKIMSAFMFKNLSTVNQISSISFTIPATMNSKVSNENQCKVPLVLQPGDTNTHNVIFDIATIQSAQKIAGSITYEVGGSSATKDFQLLVPVSAYVLPIKLTKEEFVEVLTQGGPFGMASTSLKSEEDLRAFLVSLATLLHVELIILESAASLYGKTVQGHHVAVYVKPVNGAVNVDLKCTDNLIAQALVAELNSFFPRA